MTVIPNFGWQEGRNSSVVLMYVGEPVSWLIPSSLDPAWHCCLYSLRIREFKVWFPIHNVKRGLPVEWWRVCGKLTISWGK